MRTLCFSHHLYFIYSIVCFYVFPGSSELAVSAEAVKSAIADFDGHYLSFCISKSVMCEDVYLPVRLSVAPKRTC